jgi:hypothetical protein
MSDYRKHDAWCELDFSGFDKQDAFIMAIVFSYGWMWLFTFLSFATIIVVTIEAMIKTGGGWFILKSIFTHAGGYSMIALTCSIPHTFRKIFQSELSLEQILFLQMPVYAAGICYGLLYWYNPGSAELPDRPHIIRETDLELTISDLEYTSENPVVRRVSRLPSQFRNADDF